MHRKTRTSIEKLNVLRDAPMRLGGIAYATDRCRVRADLGLRRRRSSRAAASRRAASSRPACSPPAFVGATTGLVGPPARTSATRHGGRRRRGRPPDAGRAGRPLRRVRPRQPPAAGRAAPAPAAPRRRRRRPRRPAGSARCPAPAQLLLRPPLGHACTWASTSPAPTGTPIHAVGAGTVFAAGWLYIGYGISVVIDHGNGFFTHYAHASDRWSRAGQPVGPGQTHRARGQHRRLHRPAPALRGAPGPVEPDRPGSVAARPRRADRLLTVPCSTRPPRARPGSLRSGPSQCSDLLDRGVAQHDPHDLVAEVDLRLGADAVALAPPAPGPGRSAGG